ncbi:porin [Thalassotalea sp. G2M2-11]|uniref:porin n=1 Tax=Thalassotalea sp. G2M2-11 TaxID=2787627 RepID=UPI0019CF76FE|nr:porin [Thalassotalea sp. G2M2-11]
MKVGYLGAIAVCACFIPGSVFAEVSISGFASINAGKVLSGSGVPQYDVPPTFLADYPIVSAYEEQWSFKPESLFGLQFSADLMDGLSVTGQVVSRGADDFDTQLEWAYLSYELNDNWTFQAGKKRLPLFYYSDFYDVGFAYVWMRPPADTYTWQVFNYNGVNALYFGEWGDWTVNGNLYFGREDSRENRLLSQFFFLEPTREIWKDIMGGVINLSNDWLEVRLTHMSYTNERYIGGVQSTWDGSNERDGKFYGISANADWGNVFILTELNRLDLGGNLDTGMVTLGYRADNIIPYVGYSRFKEDASDGENHNSTFIGLRWDFHPSAAFKVQYDDVEDKSFELAVAGDSKSLTFGIDIVF